MLSNAMPGLRELRAPLAAGYLWILWAWLLVGDKLPSSDAPGAFQAVYELGPVVSDLGRAVVASIAAYMVGSIAIDAQVRIGRPFGSGIDEAENVRDAHAKTPKAAWIQRIDPHEMQVAVSLETGDGESSQEEQTEWMPLGLPMTEAGASALAQIVSATNPADFQRAAWKAQRWIALNRAMLKTRLLDLSPALHAEVDRPDAEATFRMALWPPLAAIAAYFVFVASFWWLLALFVPMLVAWQWIRLRRQANDALITAIAVRDELQSLVVGEPSALTRVTVRTRERT